MITLGTKVKVVRKDSSFDNGCIGKVIKISVGLNNQFEYTIQTSEGFFCNVFPDEFEVISEDYVDLGSIEFDN